MEGSAEQRWYLVFVGKEEAGVCTVRVVSLHPEDENEHPTVDAVWGCSGSTHRAETPGWCHWQVEGHRDSATFAGGDGEKSPEGPTCDPKKRLCVVLLKTEAMVCIPSSFRQQTEPLPCPVALGWIRQPRTGLGRV